MTDNQKPLKLEEMAAQLLESGKAESMDIAILMARQMKAKETAKVAARQLKLAQAKAKQLNVENERKARTHRLIQLGGLIEMAELGEADRAELLGWLFNYRDMLKSSSREFLDLRAACKAKGQEALEKNTSARFYLDVPYAEKNEAKTLGAAWDKLEKKWYCKITDSEKFSKWFPKTEA